MRDPIILLVHLIATLARLMGPCGLRSAVCRRRIAAGQAAIAHPQSLATPGAESPPIGSDPRRRVCAVHAPRPRAPLGDRAQAVDDPRFSSDAASPQIPLAIFPQAPSHRPERVIPSPGGRHCGDEAAQSLVGVSADRPADSVSPSTSQIDKDVVRRVLATHYRPGPGGSGPSWLTFLGHTKDSLWSMDLFRCESAVLRSHWVLVVMDHYTRRIIGFGVHAGIVDGRALCRMFNHAIRGPLSPTRLSADHDPLYRFHQWQANLRVLRVTEVKSVPYVPVSHPFVERLIGTLRRECVDRMLFWSTSDLEHKLVEFQDFYNVHRAHAALEGRPPVPKRKDVARLDRYGWQAHCRGLYQTPIAA